MMNEADMDDIIGLLDLCLPSQLPSFGIDCFNGGPPPLAFHKSDAQNTSDITKKQLRALDKEHLLTMLRDAEKELEQERERSGYLLRACQAITPSQGSKRYGINEYAKE